MSIKYQIVFIIFVLAGIGFKLCAYHYNDANFWKQFDTGSILISIGIIVLASQNISTSIVAFLYLALNINSAITSFFFDVEKFEVNQKIFGWIVAAAFFIIGVAYNAFKLVIHRQVTKRNELCKKDARDKYRNIIDRMVHMEGKLDSKTQQIDDFLKKLTHG